ncbi:MAG: hypothetical protein R3310_12115 [Candidatus Competibacteraceae bacterium]|nr:hypothetical protein [Candidatus Competibacteraceae bacterium]
MCFAFNYGPEAVATPVPPRAALLLEGRHLEARQLAAWRELRP